MEVRTINIDITAATNIKNYMKTYGYKLMKISTDLDINKGHLSHILAGNRPLSDTLKTKLNEYLGTDF